MSEVVIGHDGRTAADSWHCEQVEIRVKGDNPFGVLSPTGSGNFSSVGLLEKSGGATGRDSPRQKDGAKRSLEATGSDSPRQRDAGNKGVEATGKKDRAFFFPAEQWFDATQGDGLTRRVLRVSRDDPRASLVGYLFRVTTSGIRGAGTDASVFVELLGEGKLSSGEKQLQSKTGEFAAGSTEEVKLTAKDVGPLSRARLRVRHDNSGLAPDWHLDLVEVVNTKTGERAYFHCGQWLSKLLGDRQIARELQAVLKDPRKERTRCKVVIHTSDLRGAGTSASVSLDFSVNKSAPILLPAGPEAFSRGSENTFFVDVPAQVTELNRVTVSHDNTGPNPGWHLDFLEVVPHFECSCSACEKGGTASGYSGGERKQSAGKKTVYFPSKKWFDKEKDDGLISRELLASTTDPRKETLTYKVTVVTGSCKGAGTDSEVSITLIGDKADNGLARVLQGPPGAFSRGSRDVFTLPLSNLGELKKVRIGHDGKGLQPGWFLDSVEVELGEKKWYFPCQSWLGSPDGGKLQSPVVKELVAASRGSSLASGGSGNIYRVSITTSDLKGASCDANVSVTIFGEKGDSGSRPLEKPGSFNRGQTDEFFLECEQALGELVRIRLGHDGSGLSPSWHVADVRVATMGYSPGSPKPDLVLKEWLFVCGNWFDTKHGDRQTVRELTPVAKGEKVAPLVQYELAVYTSDVKGAGTDATVHVTLFGDVSNTSPRTLSCGPEAFERGACDRFVIEAADVGPLRKLRIGHDGKGARAEWHLDRVEISVKTPGSKTGVGAAAAKAPIYTFPCGRWLAKGREDGAIERELLAGGGGGKVSRTSYS